MERQHGVLRSGSHSIFWFCRIQVPNKVQNVRIGARLQEGAAFHVREHSSFTMKVENKIDNEADLCGVLGTLCKNELKQALINFKYQASFDYLTLEQND